MTRSVTLHLDEFGQQLLGRFVDKRAGTLTTAVRTAALYYLSQHDHAGPAWRVPRFQHGQASDDVIRVVFDDDTWTALEAEALRQDVEPSELAVHALLYYLSDFDRGRLADVLDERLRDEQ
jgi:hypothetical protein